jgi:hypothetical protein
MVWLAISQLSGNLQSDAGGPLSEGVAAAHAGMDHAS